MTEYKEIRKTYAFRIMGKVKAKQSVKFGANGVKYTPSDMVNYANWVKTCFYKEYPGHLPSELDGYNLTVQIYAYMSYPKSFSKEKRKLAEEWKIRPTVKPDWDNISKNICDALNGVAWPDDKAITDGAVHKYYDEYDYVNVIIFAQKWIKE